MRKLLFTCLIAAASVACLAGNRLTGYAFHQTFAEATLPPLYPEVVADMKLAPAQVEAWRSHQSVRTYIDQWAWLKSSERSKRLSLALLDEEQRGRLEELSIQHAGFLYTLIRPSIQGKLNVEARQAEQIASLFLEFVNDERQIPAQNAQGEWVWKQHGVAVEHLKAKYDSRAHLLLSESQQKMLASFAGRRLAPQVWRRATD